jgi:hypothetical protein
MAEDELAEHGDIPGGLSRSNADAARKAERDGFTEAPSIDRELFALGQRRAGSADEARALREAWRAYLRTHPTGPQLDAARVRMIESGATAWRLGHDPADLKIVRADAAAYLARPGAAQQAHVRHLLADLPQE